MTALLFSDAPDLTADFWRVPNVSTELIVRDNGCRLHVEHWQKVQRARLALEAVLPSSTPPASRAVVR